MAELSWDEIRSEFADFLFRAGEPMRHVGWETGVVFAFCILFVALITTALLRHSWRFSKPALPRLTIKGAAHSFTSNLRLNGAQYLAFRKVGGGIQSPQARTVIAQDSSKYYVITIVDAERKRPVLYKEMLIQPGQGRGHLIENEIQVDQADLTRIRLNNLYDDDDAEGQPVSGKYDLYIRPVRWWDVRHWLLHPNREIRLVVWVTIISTLIPILMDVGESAAHLLGTG